MKVLIIGGTGNIGTSITRGLAQNGVDLTLFKRSETLPEGVTGVEIIAGDRTKQADFRSKLAGKGPFDCVIDMVCYEPEDAAIDVEIFRGRTEQFIFCSTVDVCKKTPPSYPVTEAGAEISALPSFPYAFKKVECERTLWEANGRGDFALTVLRPGFTYNESWSPGIHSFGGQTYHLDRLRKGKPIIMHGDGTSIWTATHRDDVAAAFIAAVRNHAAYGQAYTVSGDEMMTHNHIWRTIARLMGAPEPDFVYIPTDLLGRLAPKEAEWCVENFRHDNIFDNSKAKRELGFRYTVPFEEGARRCIEYLTTKGSIESCDHHPFYDRVVETWRKHSAAMVLA
jgi:nucleoside-diphosphate-sugar epimerase